MLLEQQDLEKDVEILDPSQVSSPTRRKIAEALGAMAEQEIYAASTGKKVSYMEYMAQMMWDLITSGQMLFTDGMPLKLESTDEWLRIVKFVSTHLDGPTGTMPEMALNLYKVYMGFDPDKV